MAPSTHEPPQRTDRTAVQARSFVLPGNDVGLLLIHGFAGSIADLRVFGEKLNALGGYTVVGVRLAGHGLTVGDLHRTAAEDWYAAARHGYHALAQRTKHIIVIGESMGALIALRLSRDYPMICGVVCVAPALHMGNETLRNVVMRIMPPMKQWRKTWVDEARAARGSLKTVTSLSYREFARVVDEERAQLKSVAIPVLGLFAEGDFVTDPKSIDVLKKALPEERLKIHAIPVNSHHLSESDQVDTLAAEIHEFALQCA